jgi:hypothetical protein
MKSLGSIPMILAAAVLGAPAAAATTISFTLGGSISSGYAGADQALNFSSGGVSVSVTAWSANNKGVISPGQLGVCLLASAKGTPAATTRTPSTTAVGPISCNCDLPIRSGGRMPGSTPVGIA